MKTIWIDEKLHNQLKILACKKEKKLSELANEIIKKDIKNNEIEEKNDERKTEELNIR